MAGEIEAVRYPEGHKQAGEQRRDKAGKLVWRLIVSCGSHNGKRRRRREYFHGTRKEAERALARIVIGMADGTLSASPQMSLKNWAMMWLDTHAAKHLAANTMAGYRPIVEKRIIPALGHIALDKLKARHISEFYTNLEEEGIRKDGRGEILSGSTRLGYHRVLSTMLQEAVYRHLIPINPARAVRPPKSNRQEARFYDEADARRLLQALDREPLRFRAFILLAITLGLRRGEIIGLEWPHIDFKRKTLAIRQAAQLVTHQGQSLKVPKTLSSARVVSIPDFVLTCLKEWKSEQERQRATATAWKPSPHGDFIFTDIDGTWYIADQVSKDFRRFADLNNLHNIPFRQLQQAAAKEPLLRFRAFALLSFSIALRRETVAGLTWDQIDLAGNVITMQQEQISIPDPTGAALAEWRQQQAEEREKAGAEWKHKRSNLVFTNPDGTRYRARHAVKDLRKFMVKHNLRTITLHGLRHTAASILLAKRLPVRTVATILGHSQTSTTLNIYSHVMQATLEQAAEVMENTLAPDSAPKDG
jgi:integrase